MKGKQVKLQLNLESMKEEFYGNAKLLGIVAPMEGYRFCWNVNRLLNFDFRINKDKEIKMIRKGREYFFPFYEYNRPPSTVKHILYSNHHDGNFLLSDLKHFDFLWLMKCEEIDQQEMDLVMDSIRLISVLQMVVELPSEKLKNIEDLFF